MTIDNDIDLPALLKEIERVRTRPARCKASEIEAVLLTARTVVARYALLQADAPPEEDGGEIPWY